MSVALEARLQSDVNWAGDWFVDGKWEVLWRKWRRDRRTGETTRTKVTQKAFVREEQCCWWSGEEFGQIFALKKTTWRK